MLRGIASSKAILVDLQRPDLRLQGGSWYAEFDGRAGGSIDPAAAFPQRSLDGCLVLRRKPLKKVRAPIRLLRRRLAGKPTFID